MLEAIIGWGLFGGLTLLAGACALFIWWHKAQLR
jgi:hypothetical protein